MYPCEILFLSRMKDEIWRLYYQEQESKATIHRRICHHGPGWVSYKLLTKEIKKWQNDPQEKDKWANQTPIKKDTNGCRVKHRHCCDGGLAAEYMEYHPERVASEVQQHSALSAQKADGFEFMLSNMSWRAQAAPADASSYADVTLNPNKATTSQEMSNQPPPQGRYTMLLRQDLPDNYLDGNAEGWTSENTGHGGQK